MRQDRTRSTRARTGRTTRLLAALGLLIAPSCADQVVFSSDTGARCGDGSVFVSGYTTSNGQYVPGYCRGGGVVIVSSSLQSRMPEPLVDELPGSWELEEESGDTPIPGVLTIGDRDHGVDLIGDGIWWPRLALGEMPLSIESRWTSSGVQLLASGGEATIEIHIEHAGPDRLRVALIGPTDDASAYGRYRRR